MTKSYNRQGIFAIFKGRGGLLDPDCDEYETFGLFLTQITGVPGPFDSAKIFKDFNMVSSCGDIPTVTMVMFYGAYIMWKEAQQPEIRNE